MTRASGRRPSPSAPPRPRSERAASVEDVAGLTAFLAADAAACVTGQAINLTGSAVMH